MLWSRPPATKTTSVSPFTCTGTALEAVVPLPRFPKSLPPHAQTVPFDRTASEWSRAPAIATTPVRPLTWTGTALDVCVPFPSWPRVFRPHIQTVPSAFSAMLE
jgi:hypothetical protein